MNYVRKLEVYLKGYEKFGTDLQRIWKCPIDANFVRQYCLLDVILNLTHFKFYIASVSESSSEDIEKRVDSFKTYPFFQNYQWTNVKCFFDPIRSCQHFFSDFPNNSLWDISTSINSLNIFVFSNYSNIFIWNYHDKFCIPAYPSLYLLLEQFNEISPNISSIKVNKSKLIYLII